MFKIGEFSRLTQVPVKTLRYYDDLGLLKAVEVDRFTGYRYYSAGQLPRLNRILALKDLGLSLAQIAQLLDADLPPAQLRGMLRLKQAELQQQMQDDQARLDRVEQRLRQIEQEEVMSTQEVVIKKIPAMTVASVRDVIPTYSDVGRLYDELMSYLGQHRVRPAGPPLAIYYDTEYRERDVDVEAAIPVLEPGLAEGRVTVKQLPAAEQMASIIHLGAFDGLTATYSRLMAWIEAHGYHISGPNREVYVQCEPGADPSTYVTEVQFPVEKG